MKRFWGIPILAIAGIVLILTFAAWLRFNGLDWDQGTHQHPDERFLTSVASDIRPSLKVSEYFDTEHSGLNPHNVGHNFYVYGTFPVILTRFVAELLGMADYQHIYLVGRALSAIFDLGTLLATALIGITLFGYRAGIAAGAFYAVAVLAIQNAHFFTVDSFGSACITWALFFAIRTADFSTRPLPNLLGLAICLGCAASSKINLAAGIALIPACLSVRVFSPASIDSPTSGGSLAQRFLRIGSLSLLTLVVAFVVFRCMFPYLFAGPGFWGMSLNPGVVENFRVLSLMVRPAFSFPPSIQWVNRSALFSGWNLAVWGTGVPFFLFAVSGLIFICRRVRSLLHPATIVVTWAFGWFLLQSLLPNPTLRYQLPALPGLAVAAGCLWAGFGRRPWQTGLGTLVFIFSFGWALAFSAIYDRPHTRVSASRWITENIASGTVLAFESAWDDAIPLRGTGDWEVIKPFLKGQRLEIHEPDTASKAIRLVSVLANADILVITSNRMYGPLCRLPGRYPMSTAFYRSLLNISANADPVRVFSDLADASLRKGSLSVNSASSSFNLGFVPIAVFTSFPGFGSLLINDQGSEEAFTVYDHPQVTLFRKTSAFDPVQAAHFFKESLQNLTSVLKLQ